jgi:hypothetical protein
VVLGCLGTEGETIRAGVHDVSKGSGGGILTADVVASSAHSDETTTNAVASNTSTIVGLNALAGMITADSVRVVASLSVDPQTITVKPGATFVNLKIAGKTVPSNIAPNTQLTLPNIGTVVVKGITRSGGPSQSMAGIKVEMLHVNVQKANRLGLPVGSVVTIGLASVRFQRAETDVVFGGKAFGTRILGQLSSTLRAKAAPTAPVILTCGGSKGRTLSNTLASQNIPAVLSTGDITDTAISRPIAGGSVATVTSDVQNVSLLSGLIHVNSIHATTTDTVKNGRRTSSTAGTKVSGLTIAGQPRSAPQPNTRVTLPGFGFAVLNEQLTRAASSRAPTIANGIRVQITVANNALGLPTGTEIVVGHAEGVAFPVQAATGAGS